MLTPSVRRTLVACLVAAAAFGLNAGVATAETPDHGNNRDRAVWACGGDDAVLVEDDDPNGSSTCYQKTITTSCDPTECVIITDDPRLSNRPNSTRPNATLAR